MATVDLAQARGVLASAQTGPLVRQLGPYQLLRKIGSGGMAEVWSARVVGTHPGEDRFFAVKLLASHLAEREEYREMFLAEARLSMMLSHPNIVKVYDAVAQQRDCYMVMELVSGMTLSQFQRALGRAQTHLSLTLTAYVIGELLRALSYAHTVRTEAGSVIVHRDVSPQNVMVTTEGEVKLMDFGIARFASEETQGSFVKGKLQYMPPEQLRKKTRKPTVDLYAVGAILHEMLDGRRFRGKIDQGTLLQMVMHGEVPPLRNPDVVPPAIEVVRCGLLEPDEDARIQTARKALGMLVRWPDYRESNSDLRGLVQRFVEPNSVFQIPETTKVSSVPEGSFSGVPLLDHDRAAASEAQLDTNAAAQTEPTGSELTAEEDPLLLSPDDVAVVDESGGARKRWPFALGGGLLVAGALAGALVMFGPGGSEQDAGSGEIADATSSGAPAEASAGEVQPASAGQPSSAGVMDSEAAGPPPEDADAGADADADAGADAGADADADAGAGDDAGGELEEPAADETGAGEPPDGSDAGDAGGADGAVPEDEAEPIPVEFVANEFFFVYVRVNGRKLTLEPRDSVKLPPGSYRVQLRQSKDEKWQSAGRIKIEAGSSYRVEMRQPAGLKLVKK